MNEDARAGPAPGRRRWLAALLPAALLLQWLASRAPWAVEAVYARGLYRLVRLVWAAATGWITFSVAESLAEGFLAGLLLMALSRAPWRSLGEAWRRPGRARWLAALGWRLSSAAGVVYAAFLLLWGLNYQRPSLARLAALEPGGGSRQELRALSEELVASANRLRLEVSEDAAGVMRLPRGQRVALDEADDGLRRAAVSLPWLGGPRVRPKPAQFSPLLSRLGIAGIFVPFTGEAHVNATLPAPDVPFAASHELAHQRGFAREDEANYIASLACRLQERPEFRYSGALISSVYVQAALAAEDRPRAVALERSRSPAVRRDLRAMAEWSRRYRSRLTEVSQSVNDAYLKSQGQELGIKSYGAMVDLLLAERRRGASLESGER